MGDPKNPVIARHVHCVGYDPAEDAFYACTGDGDRPEGFECRWLRGTYDWSTDCWDWSVIHSDHLNTRYKSGGTNLRDGRLYFISDANGPEPYDRGIFSCAPEDLPHPERHALLYDPGVECACCLWRMTWSSRRTSHPPHHSTQASSSRWMVARHLRSTILLSQASARRCASIRPTARAGSGWTCGSGGSTLARCVF